MNQSENINELATALAKAQGAIGTASKDKTNPHFKSSYADLASVWEACRDPLSANGLAIIQTTAPTDTGIVLHTILTHSSGQWIRGVMVVDPGPKGGMQPLGSALTYARRYSLSALVGISPADDDGNAAQQNHGGAPAQRRTQAPPKQSAKLKEAIRDIQAAGSQSELAAVGGSLKGMQLTPEDREQAKVAYAAKLNTFGGEG